MGKPKQKIAITFYICFVVISFSSCQKNHLLPEWLIGTWETKFDKIVVIETWKKSNNKLVGETLWKNQKNTRKEKIALYFRNDLLIYHIEMQDKQIDFVCNSPKNDTLVFINNQNDFPKRIIYVKPTSDNMHVWIDNMAGDPNEMSFPFKKINE